LIIRYLRELPEKQFFLYGNRLMVIKLKNGIEVNADRYTGI
jgi:hypothetical protein